MSAVWTVRLGGLDDLLVAFRIVVNVTLTESGNMVQSMHEVSGPEECTSILPYVVSHAAKRRERAANFERKRADDSLFSGIVAAPVTSPS